MIQYQKPKIENNWCRGVIVKVRGNRQLNVFLRDIGITVTVQPHEAIPTSEELSSFKDCVTKCHLDLSKEWPISSTDILTDIVSGYKHFSVSYGADNGITLWAKNANSSDWDNVGMMLISKSISDCLLFLIEKIEYRKIHPKNLEDTSDSDTSDKVQLKKLMGSVMDDISDSICEEWLVPDSDQEWPQALPLQLPAQPLRGIVTHVTKTGIIHFLEESDCVVANDMSNQIKAIVKSQPKTRTNWVWKIDDICFSKYEEDGEFYRAKIVDINFEEGIYTVSKIVMKNLYDIS